MPFICDAAVRCPVPRPAGFLHLAPPSMCPSLQSTVEHLQQTLDSKTAELTRLTMKLEEASASADRTQQALRGQVAELEAGLAAAEAARGAVQARVGGLEGRLQQLIDASAAKEAELGAELEAANAAREATARELASVNMRLEIVTQEAAAKVGGLAGCRAGRGGKGRKGEGARSLYCTPCLAVTAASRSCPLPPSMGRCQQLANAHASPLRCAAGRVPAGAGGGPGSREGCPVRGAHAG
jgi:hypothetical protein